mgnify:FL=1
MSKRFHDTDIWDEDWYLDMPLEYRSFWGYVCDKCDHAGIWRPNVRRFNADIDNKVDLDTALTFFNTNKERILPLESGHWMIKDFVPFQYGKSLNKNNRVHLSVFNRLTDLEVNLGSIRGLNEVKEGSSRPQVEVKEGVKDKDKDIIVILSNRLKAFKVIVYKYSDKYPKELLDEFFDYWSELNRSKTKMRWERENTWDLGKRIKRWADKDLSGIMQNKNGVKKKTNFKITDGKNYLAWCGKCGVSDFYEPFNFDPAKIESKCCNSLLVPSKPSVEQNYQSQEIY